MKLTDSLTEHFRLTPIQKKALSHLKINTVSDLLFYLPFRYDMGGEGSSIAGLVPGMSASVVGVLEKLETRKSWKRKIPVGEGRIKDGSGMIKVMWFNQPYLAKKFAEGTLVRATGKIGGTPGKLYLANPEIEPADKLPEGELFDQQQTTDNEKPDVQMFAMYPETSGVTSLWFRHALERVFKSGALEQVVDPIPESIISKYHLPKLSTALVWIHTPQNDKDATAARKRFAFEEVFLIQVERGMERARQAHEKSFKIDAPEEDIQGFVDSFAFTATRAQQNAIAAIVKDMKSGTPMSRLLEGDVGSGKTAVAATAAYAVVRTRPTGQNFGTLQVAYMAPTEILAKQHFESFIKVFEHHPVPIALITGSGCYKFPSKVFGGKQTPISRTQLLKWVANGEIPIVIGTHALIEKAVKFKHLALVIIDEQHRFGTNQRKKLARKDIAIPHLLSMTATPIPRTLALTIYGDLDLTLLDEMPPGRKPIITEILGPESRENAYRRIRQELEAGRQAYIICPRIDEPDPKKEMALQAKSVTAEAKRLGETVFADWGLDILHSKMKPAEKDAVMKDFAEHKTDILVATSVVEVGVNVPNATCILIEGAERFGLSQLHQLRGRVVRSSHQAYCFALAESKGDRTRERLQALKTAKNGFELAEKDLMQRGPGELSGRRQWGISDIGMEALKNLKLVEAARDEALALVKSDETLAKHPMLRQKIEARVGQLHFE
jgi:ATP-dependent DNA helicase RecG